jgi:hypothetical protein
MMKTDPRRPVPQPPWPPTADLEIETFTTPQTQENGEPPSRPLRHDNCKLLSVTLQTSDLQHGRELLVMRLLAQSTIQGLSLPDLGRFKPAYSFADLRPTRLIRLLLRLRLLPLILRSSYIFCARKNPLYTIPVAKRRLPPTKLAWQTVSLCTLIPLMPIHFGMIRLALPYLAECISAFPYLSLTFSVATWQPS